MPTISRGAKPTIRSCPAIADPLTRITGRLDPRGRPPGSQPFEIVMFAHVLDVPGQGADDAETSPDT